eukprot:1575515-Prymnesium_polylepis.2
MARAQVGERAPFRPLKNAHHDSRRIASRSAACVADTTAIGKSLREYFTCKESTRAVKGSGR